MNKVIFLDIDGVLNSGSWNESHQWEISDSILVDEEKVRLLAELVHRTDALNEPEIESHQVRTDQTVGLMPEDVEKAEGILETESRL